MVHCRFAVSGIVLVSLLLGLAPGARADYGVTTSRPLSDPLKAELDPRLIGTWRTIIRGNAYFFHIGAGNILGKLNWMELVLVKPGTKRPEFYMRHFIGFPTKIGDVTYFNVGYQPKMIPQLRGATPEQVTASVDRYDIFLYKLEGDTLDIFAPNQRFIREAIKAGKIKGSGSKIEDTPENVIKFIKASGKTLFPRKFRYTRVKVPKAPAKKPAEGKPAAKTPAK